MSEWRKIDTAPKDGSYILGYLLDSGSYAITSWHDDVWAVQGGKGGPSGWFSGRYDDCYGDHPILDYPSHWQPLPVPPVSD